LIGSRNCAHIRGLATRSHNPDHWTQWPTFAQNMRAANAPPHRKLGPLIDALGLIPPGTAGFFGGSVRPFLGLFLLMALRQPDAKPSAHCHLHPKHDLALPRDSPRYWCDPTHVANELFLLGAYGYRGFSERLSCPACDGNGLTVLAVLICHLRSGNSADLASALHHGLCSQGIVAALWVANFSERVAPPDRSTNCWWQIGLRILQRPIVRDMCQCFYHNSQCNHFRSGRPFQQ